MTGRPTTGSDSDRDLPRGNTHRLAAGLLAGLLSGGATAQIIPAESRYELFDLGTLGGQGSMALGMNDLGDVVGWAENGSGRVHAFLHEGEQMIDLGTLGGRYSEARGVNSFKQVVGVATDENEQLRPFYAWNGMLFDLNDLLVQSVSLPPVPVNSVSPELMEPNAINENGVIVAVGTNGQDDLIRTYVLHPVDLFDPYEPRFTYTEAGSFPAAEPSQSLFRLVSNGDQADPSGQPSVGPAVTVGLGLNDFDQVVGASAEQAFLWLENELDGLLAVGQTSQANAISNWGLIVGWTAGAAGNPHASLWSVWMPDEVWGLGTPQGWISEALDINSFGTAVGWAADNSESDDAFAMVWTDDLAWKLDDITVVPEGPAFWESLEEATAVNEQQRIVGYGRLTDGNVRAYVLVPIEPDPNADPGD